MHNYSAKKLTICYLSGVNSPHTVKWCAFFADLGHDVHLISFDKGEIKNVTVHYLDIGVRSNSTQFKKIKFLFQTRKIREIIRIIKPDVLHAHRLTGYAYLAAQTDFHPYVLSVWGGDVYDFPYTSPLHKFFVKYNLSKADYIFSTSHAMKNQTSIFTQKTIEVTPFGVDLNFFKPKDTTLPTTKDNTLVIGTVKTLEKQYGIEYLMRAFKRLTENHSNLKVELYIAGRGSQKDELMKLATKLNLLDKVTFAGYLAGDEIVKAYQKLSVAVFPSLSESFGVAAVEAQACGIPVIASNVGGLPEATSPGKSAVLFESKNTEMLAKEIETLLSNPGLRHEMGKAGRQFVEENFNINDNFLAVEKLYYSITNTKIG